MTAARALGHALVERGVGLVYGGANVGLMGAVADAVIVEGGEVIGVMSVNLVEEEIAHTGLTRLHVVDSMHERKAKMAELSDGVITLPGGLGTLEETLDVLTWGQLRLQAKPCGILNICNYYDHLVKLLDHAVNERFLKPIHRNTLLVASQPSDLLDQMGDYEHPHAEKWLDVALSQTVDSFSIHTLASHGSLVSRLAAAHFEYWGPLTGKSTLSGYTELLRSCASASGLPTTLIALRDEHLLGSVNLVECDLPMRPKLTPWLGQLYVFPDARSLGVGAALVQAAIEETRRLSWPTLYLYTAGTLPEYYARLGWQMKEKVDYRGCERTVMEIDTNAVRQD